MGITFMGDTHGVKLIETLMPKCGDIIIQVGDWGYAWPHDFKVTWLSRLLEKHHKKMFFVDGNHDHHPFLSHLPDCEENLAPNITYQRRGSVRTIEGWKMGFMGGAASIDYKNRIEGLSWWEEECNTKYPFNETINSVDILVAHDSFMPLPGFKQINDARFNLHDKENKFWLSEAVHRLQPHMYIHGHYHHHYTQHHGDNLRIIGLNMVHLNVPSDECLFNLEY